MGSKLEPNSVPVLSPKFRKKHKQKKPEPELGQSLQVKMFLLWVAYMNATGFSLNDAVWINIDETPISYDGDNSNGVRKQPTNKDDAATMRNKTTLSTQRSCSAGSRGCRAAPDYSCAEKEACSEGPVACRAATYRTMA